jgi:hypothetical protein
VLDHAGKVRMQQRFAAVKAYVEKVDGPAIVENALYDLPR